MGEGGKMKKKVKFLPTIVILFIIICMNISLGDYEKGSMAYTIKTTQVYAGTSNDTIIATIEGGSEVKILKYDSSSDRYWVEYDKKGRKGGIDASDLVDRKPTEQDQQNKEESEINKFIEDQKDREYENIVLYDPESLIKTYNTASTDLDKTNDPGQKSDLRNIMSRIYTVLTNNGWTLQRKTKW